MDVSFSVVRIRVVQVSGMGNRKKNEIARDGEGERGSAVRVCVEGEGGARVSISALSILYPFSLR